MHKKEIGAGLLVAVAVASGIAGFSALSHRTRSVHDAEAELPNVVLIIIDTLRADLLGCYGFPREISPEIDEIARRGVLFETCIAQCSWTRPSIASMVTSLYPRTLGIYKEQYDILADRHLTLAEILKNSGYSTFGITANPHLNKAFNFHQGFEQYVETRATWDEMKAKRPGGGRKTSQKRELPKSREVFDRVLLMAGDTEEGPNYVQINIMEVHSPSLLRREYRHAFDSLPVPVKETVPPKRKARVKHLVRRTCSAVEQVSHDTGEFVEKLTSLPGWNNTLFIITSDHGQGLNDHPDVEKSSHHGNLLYESQVLVPLLLYNPADSLGIPAGKRVTERVRLLDLVPTVLEYAGIPVPEGLAGRSVLSMATGIGESPDLPSVFVTETNWRDVNKIAAYGGSWKYIQNRDGWEGVNNFELQRFGMKENGALTDEYNGHTEEAKSLRRFLVRWESEFELVESTQPDEGPSEEEINQLRSLGYIR